MDKGIVKRTLEVLTEAGWKIITEGQCLSSFLTRQWRTFNRDFLEFGDPHWYQYRISHRFLIYLFYHKLLLHSNVYFEYTLFRPRLFSEISLRISNHRTYLAHCSCKNVGDDQIAIDLAIFISNITNYKFLD